MFLFGKLNRSNLFFRSESGAAAVEFALLLPLLLSLFLGIVDLGLAVYTQSVLSNASREGARAGVVLALNRPTSQAINAVVQNYLSNSLGSVNKFGLLAFTPPPLCRCQWHVDRANELQLQRLCHGGGGQRLQSTDCSGCPYHDGLRVMR